jgi:hypothetical protein
MDLYGENFWIWKFAFVSLCLFIGGLHFKFRRVMAAIVSVGSIYLGVVLYQILIILIWIK